MIVAPGGGKMRDPGNEVELRPGILLNSLDVICPFLYNLAPKEDHRSR